MIFVTVGTHQQPFDRLIRGLKDIASDGLIVQYGHAQAPSGVLRGVPFMSFPEMLDNFRQADAVITHAGVGSILCAANAGHVPVVVPRLKRYREHVDDHQGQLVRALERNGAIVAVWDVDRLATALAEVPARRPPVERPAGPLQTSVRAALWGGLD